MSKKVFRLCTAMALYICFITVFFSLKSYLGLYEIEYRYWLDTLGNLVIWMAPIVILALWIRLGFSRLLQQKQEQELPDNGLRVARTIVYIVYTLISLGVLLFAGLFYLITMHEERVTSDGQLQVMYGGFLDESVWYDYDRVSFWGREYTFPRNARAMLREKYGCDFKLIGLNMDVGQTYFASEYHPDIAVKVYDIDKKEDDYREEYLNDLFKKGMNELGLRSQSNITDFDTGHETYYLYQKVRDKDLDLLADEGARLIAFMQEQIKLDEHAPCIGGSLYLALQYHSCSLKYVSIPFAKTAVDKKEIYKLLLELPDEEDQAYSYEETITEDEDDDTSEEVVSEDSWEGTIGRLAEQIYDEQLKDTEDHFEMTANAKGNPYAILGEGSVSDENKAATTSRRTLVYDRTSKNGQCELFVYYEEYYDEQGNQLDQTSILDIYAIELESGKIYPSGKHAWADVGNAEYRKATGE